MIVGIMMQRNWLPLAYKTVSLSPKHNSAQCQGYRMVRKNFQLLAKFGLCSICSKNLEECSLARSRKIFAIARMLGFWLKFARFLKIS